MKTKIPVGTVVKMRYQGEWEYARVVSCPRNPDGSKTGAARGCVYPEGDDFGIQLGNFTEQEMKTATKAVWKDGGMILVARP
jgi:hypothetical protein